jgi:hypothetical protein
VTHIVTTNGASSLKAQNGSVEASQDVIAGGTIRPRGGLIYADQGAESVLMLASNEAMQFLRDVDITSPEPDRPSEWFRWFGTKLGQGGVGEPFEIMRLNDDVTPDLGVLGSFQSPETSVALQMQSSDPTLGPGDVVSLDPQQPGYVVRTAPHGQPFGVIVEGGGLVLGAALGGVSPELLQAATQAGWSGDFATQALLLAQWMAAQEAADFVRVAVGGVAMVKLADSGPAPALGEGVGPAPQAGKGMRQLSGPTVGVALANGAPGGQVLALIRPQAAPGGSELAASAPGGSGALAQGATSVLVQAAGFGAADNPVVTFYGDPGSRSWVEQKGEGWFVLRLAEPAPAAVSFGWTALRSH